jgi:hypothetical protein
MVYSRLDRAGVTSLYPGFEEWFAGKVIPGIRNGERRIMTSTAGGKLSGIAICKRSHTERKLCTLWVSPHARGRGIAAELSSAAFTWLGTTKPVFTVPEERLPEFRKLLCAWSFYNHFECLGLYRARKVEHVFNGRH